MGIIFPRTDTSIRPTVGAQTKNWAMFPPFDLVFAYPLSPRPGCATESDRHVQGRSFAVTGTRHRRPLYPAPSLLQEGSALRWGRVGTHPMRECRSSPR